MTTRKRILANPRVDELWNEGEDGWWAAPKKGYCVPLMNCHTIHEDTLREIAEVVRDISPCSCPECLPTWEAGTPASEFHSCQCAERAKTTALFTEDECGWRYRAPRGFSFGGELHEFVYDRSEWRTRSEAYADAKEREAANPLELCRSNCETCGAFYAWVPRSLDDE